MSESLPVNYSLIIPHKNIPKLLKRCLDSTPQRDDMEIIVVDDNSDPDIVDFEHFPGKDRSNVQIVFDKKGGGGGYARNLGMALAKGKWILFADADDYFTYCLDEMLDRYVDSDADIVFFNVIGCHTEYYNAVSRGAHLNALIELAKTNRSLAEKKLRFQFGEPWCKLIRRSLIEQNGICFDGTPIHNDMTFSYLVGYYAKAVEIDRHAIYVLTVRNFSVSQTIDEAILLARVEIFARKEGFLRSHGVTGCRVNRHYREFLKAICSRKKMLIQKEAEIILSYNPSHFSVFVNILKLLPHSTLVRVKRFARNVFVLFHLLPPQKEDYES